MVTVQEAFAILQEQQFPLEIIDKELSKTNKYVLAQDVYAPISMPPFRQSAMDGFALGLHQGLEYQIIGEIKAGDAHQVVLLPGQAVKIFTGAPVPDSAEAVIQIEKVSVQNNLLTLDEVPKRQLNIRPIGEQNLQGDLALAKGTLLNAACIGFLAGLGFTTIPVFSKPKIGIIITGNELVSPGQPLDYGKIYESNSVMLQTALRDAFFTQISTYTVNDNLENTTQTLKKALIENEVVLLSGGISVGDYDFVAQALKDLEVETLFYKVKQKPGKPLFAGRLKHKMIFALPGNPAASLTCFYVYVLPTIQIISGQKSNYQQTEIKKLAHDFTVSNARNQFLKAQVIGNEVHILTHQNSSMLNTFAVSNALVYVEEGGYELNKGAEVAVFVL